MITVIECRPSGSEKTTPDLKALTHQSVIMATNVLYFFARFGIVSHEARRPRL